MVLTQVALVPLLKIYGDLGINGTFLAIWLVHIGFGMPLAVYIIRNYMATLPRKSSSRPRSTGPATSRPSGG